MSDHRCLSLEQLVAVVDGDRAAFDAIPAARNEAEASELAIRLAEDTGSGFVMRPGSGSRIAVTRSFYGPAYVGPTPAPTNFRGLSAIEQLRIMSIAVSSFMEFVGELLVNRTIVIANHGFWQACPAAAQGLEASVAAFTLSEIARVWMRLGQEPLAGVGQLVTGAPSLPSSPRRDPR